MATSGKSIRLSNVVALALAMFMLSTMAEARGRVLVEAAAANGTAAGSAAAANGTAAAATNGSAAAGSVAAGGSVFDVTKFGAKSNDPTMDNAQAFMQAWNAACKGPTGATKVVIPAGNYMAGPTVFQGPCTANPVTVDVQGTIKAVADASLYTDGDWFTIERVDGVILKGGVFDGQGSTVWQYNDCKKNPKCIHLPISIHFSWSKNVHMEGVTSLNSMGFHTAMTFSNNVTFTKLNISAPGDSPNTDGIHVSTTHGVSITDTSIATGDDCLGIIQGVSDVEVSNVKCGPGHGLSIGSLGKYRGETDVKGVHIRNCTLTGSTNGVRIKSFPGKLNLVASDIIFEDIVMNNVANPVIIDQFYGAHRVLKGASNVKVQDVHFRNIRGTTISNVGVFLACSSLFPCQAELSDIDLTYVGRRPNFTSSCLNAKPTFSGKMNPPPCA